MAEARFIHLEGVESPCLLVCHDDDIPEELVVDYPDAEVPTSHLSVRGKIVYRLQPTTAKGAHPVYVEVFDE